MIPTLRISLRQILQPRRKLLMNRRILARQCLSQLLPEEVIKLSTVDWSMEGEFLVDPSRDIGELNFGGFTLGVGTGVREDYEHEFYPVVHIKGLPCHAVGVVWG